MNKSLVKFKIENKGKIKILLFVFILISIEIRAQQLSLTTFQNNNPELFNPSAWNNDILKYSFVPKNEFFSYYRSQWTGFDLGPKYFGCHYNHIGDNKVISGIGFIHESFGPLSSSNILGQYAYKLNLNNRSFISGGLGLGLNFNGYDPTKITIRDQDDPIAENSENTFGLTFTPGIFLASSTKKDIAYNIGLSFNNFVSLLFSKSNNIKALGVIIFHGSVTKFLSKGYNNLSFYDISLVHRQYKAISDDTDISFKYQWKGLVSLKSGFRFGLMNEFSAHGVHFDLGIPLSNSLKLNMKGLDLNYSCELPLGQNGSYFGLSHEFSVGFLF